MTTSRMIDGDAFSTALATLGATDRDLLVVTSDLAAFGTVTGTIDDGVSAFAGRLRDSACANATIVVPTFTYTTGQENPYVHEESRSETGVYTEYLRRLPGAHRSLHPALSFAAVGPRAGAICDDASPHAYGWDSPPQRLIAADAFVVSIGRSLHRGSFFIHLAEALYGVPYRYTKELAIPVIVDGQPLRKAFYHFVRYAGSDIVLDTNRLVERLETRGIVQFLPLGLSGIWAYRAREVFDATIALLNRNIYGLLDHAPVDRPWQQ